MALLDLLPHSEATHVAANSGSWFDPDTWLPKEVPPANAKVLIPYGKTVSYDGKSDQTIKIIRVDGNLEFATNKDTELVVDTLITDTKSNLQIGTEENPIQAGNTARIIIDGSEPIDKDWDPTQVSRGVVTHGRVRIFGQEKDDFVTLAKDAKAGDSQLVLKAPPEGWEVGDKLVLGGTGRNENGSHADNSKFQDEELTITSIKGNIVEFTNDDVDSPSENKVLRFDHVRPEGYEDKLNLYVANTTRNVSIETGDAEQVPIQQRGHTMFMHNPDVIVQNAGFYSLGRTDKSKLIDDVGTNRDGSVGRGTNVRSRYAFHFHKTGVDDPDGKAAIAKGNAVVDTPGWAMVHHGSNAILEDNVVFDFYGSGIVSEDGDELGAWRNNITIKGTGISDLQSKNNSFGSNKPRLKRFDMGFGGEGYWVQGAGLVEMENNIAISTGTGINLFGGGDGGDAARPINKIPTENLPEALRDIAPGEEMVSVTQVPLTQFSGFENYNSDQGIIFWARVRDDRGDNLHDVRTTAEDFKLWNIEDKGIDIWYSTKIDFKDGLVLGDAKSPQGSGITGNTLGQDHLYRNIQVEGFDAGFRVPREGPDEGERSLASRLEDSVFKNNRLDLTKENSKELDPNDRDTQVFPDYFEIVNTTFDSASGNTAPQAAFSYQDLGGKGIAFDAGASFDTDEAKSKQLSNNAIASYGWDFDNDGRIDDFGKQARHSFSSAGTQKVGLTVWDEQGASSKSVTTINVADSAYPNLLENGDFSKPINTKGGNFINDFTANEGWITRSWAYDSNLDGDGAAYVNGATGGGILSQVLLDQKIRKGEQTLSFDLKNVEGNADENSLKVSVWGINGERGIGALSIRGPEANGQLPFSRVKLADQTVGGVSFDWKTFNSNVDFGDGYETVLVQVDADGISNSKDFIGIDNVSISGGGGSTPPADSVPPTTPPPTTPPSTPPAPTPPAPPAPPSTPPAPTPPAPPTPPSTPIAPPSSSTGLSIRVDAEDMVRSNYRLELSNFSSSGKFLSFKGRTRDEKGTASTEFSGESGSYDVVASYVDEKDGVASLSLEHNGNQLDAWKLDANLGSAGISNKNIVRRTVADGLAIEKGDTFQLLGVENGNEHARVEYLEFIPTDSIQSQVSQEPVQSEPKTLISPASSTETSTPNEPVSQQVSGLTTPVSLPIAESINDSNYISSDITMDLANGFSRIAISADGNSFDRDDWAATAAALAMIAEEGFQDKLVHLDFNNNLGKTGSVGESEMRTSALEGGKRFGFDTSKFYDNQKDLTGSIDSLKQAINASSASNRLAIVAAGPMEVIWRGLKNSDASKHKHVTLISHSSWNANFTLGESVHNLDSILRDYPGVEYTKIAGQNARKIFSTEKDFGPWQWLKQSDDPNLRWLYSRMEATGKADISDAGMVYYVLTGDERGSSSKLQAYLEGGSVPVPAPEPVSAPEPVAQSSVDPIVDTSPSTAPDSVEPKPLSTTGSALRVEAESMLSIGVQQMGLTNYRTELSSFASGGKLLSLKGGALDEIAESELNFTGASGNYNVVVRYVDETDGEAQFEFKKNGNVVSSWIADQDLGSGGISSENLVSRTVSTDLSIKKGDSLSLKGIENGREHARIDYIEFQPVEQSSPVTSLSEQPYTGSAKGTGLKATYFDGSDFNRKVLSRTDKTVDFDWGKGGPDALLGSDNFSVRWEGYVEAEHSETYDFSTYSDDGIRLWVDDKLIIDNWTTHAPTTDVGSIELEQGEKYAIQLEYFENKGGAVSQLRWSSNSQTTEIIPQSQLYSAIAPSPVGSL
ncbi:MAG: PA14 domain-containing protein [Cyanobacteria bacterium P01_D01_bin.1]